MAKAKTGAEFMGQGSVLPPGSAPPSAAKPEGAYEVRIDGFDDSGHVRCIYPGDFVKHHGAASVEELTPKVVNQLRARYGLESVEFEAVPTGIEAGQVFRARG